MVKFEIFIHKRADQVLSDKGLYQEVKDILQTVKRVNHDEIQTEFRNKIWIIEKQIHPGTTWAWDAFKNKVAVSVEFNNFNAVSRDFLRAILKHKHGDLDVLIYITQTFKEPKFSNVKRDIEIFKELLSLPILLVGVHMT